jgi:hypothetical protein
MFQRTPRVSEGQDLNLSMRGGGGSAKVKAIMSNKLEGFLALGNVGSSSSRARMRSACGIMAGTMISSLYLFLFRISRTGPKSRYRCICFSGAGPSAACVVPVPA